VERQELGKALANISVATSEQWKDKNSGEKQEKTEWHRVVAFGRTAEIMGEYLKSGSKVYIEGKLQTRKWIDKDGNERYTTEIVCLDMQMLGSVQKSGLSNNNGQEQSMDDGTTPGTDDFDDDIPF